MAARTNPASALAEKMVRVLQSLRSLGPDSYPVSLRRLAELSDATAPARLILSAASPQQKAFRQYALAARKDLDAPVALTEDVHLLAESALLLAFAFQVTRTVGTHAFTVPGLKKKLTSDLQKPFQEALTRRLDGETLPAGVGWILIKGKKNLFLLNDLHTSRAAPARKAELLAVAPRPAQDFATSFDDAFRQLDREAGNHNLVSLVDLRRRLSAGPAQFNAELRELRLAGLYTLSAAEGRHGLGPQERDAGIAEDGTLLLYVSRKTP
jgi:hypothetical protein